MKRASLTSLTFTSLAIASLFAGCAQHDTTPRTATIATTSTTTVTSRMVDSPERYVIQPGDLLTITFAGEPDYNQQVRVDWNGRIALPWLSGGGERAEIYAAGLSASALASRISAMASQNDILVEPRAQVFVSDYAPSTFTVLGQVNTPGRYTFPRGLPPQIAIEEAIGYGGGFTRLARESHVIVKRGGQIHRVNMRNMTTRPGNGDFTIQPGDVITVNERIF